VTRRLDDTRCVQKANALTLVVWKKYALTLCVWKADALALVVRMPNAVAHLVRTVAIYLAIHRSEGGATL
jgi:hypothetical protein